MFSLRFTYRFEAAHRFLDSAAPACMTPHGHTWKATLVVSSEHALDSRGMVEEFGTLKNGWKTFIQTVVDHSYLHHVSDPLLAPMTQHVTGLRALPFPSDPTTEVIAACFLKKATALGISRGPKLVDGSEEPLEFQLGIEIEETATNTVRLNLAPGDNVERWVPSLRHWDGWWSDPDLGARWIAARKQTGDRVSVGASIGAWV